MMMECKEDSRTKRTRSQQHSYGKKKQELEYLIQEHETLSKTQKELLLDKADLEIKFEKYVEFLKMIERHCSKPPEQICQTNISQSFPQMPVYP